MKKIEELNKIIEDGYKPITTIEEAERFGKTHMKKRHRCPYCNKLSYFCHSVNGSGWYCYDGCWSTTGWDHRTKDGIPLWLKTKEEREEYHKVNGSVFENK